MCKLKLGSLTKWLKLETRRATYAETEGTASLTSLKKLWMLCTLLIPTLNIIASLHHILLESLPISFIEFYTHLEAQGGAEMDKSSCEATEVWWRKETVAVVTGANRGIGMEIVRLLADKGITVVLTARCRQQQDLSQQSRALMEEVRKNVVFHTLDIQRDDSVTAFAQWLKNEFGGLDILINNAAVGGVKVDWDLLEKRQMDFRKTLVEGSCEEALTEDKETAKECLGTNYYGTKRITKALIPLLKSSTAEARIVNVSSVLGLLKFLRSETLQRQLSDIENISEEVIDCIVKQFMEDIERGADLRDSVWPVRFPTYSLSKVALNAYTRLLARDLNGEACVNSAHPGYVRTSMTFDTGDISSVEGAENVVRVALLPPSGPSGKNFLQAQIAPF